MAKRVTELEERALDVAIDMFTAVPAQYRERPDPDDPLGAAWVTALKAATQASIDLERLGDLLRAKAGIAEPGPTAQLMADEPEPDAETTRSVRAKVNETL
jgi:hypothetical protein